jgi:hypothetical protein
MSSSKIELLNSWLATARTDSHANGCHLHLARRSAPFAWDHKFCVEVR